MDSDSLNENFADFLSFHLLNLSRVRVTLYLCCNTIIEEGGSLAAVLQKVLRTDLCPVLGGFGKSLWVTSTNLGTFAPIYR